jgi:hypothetical protein
MRFPVALATVLVLLAAAAPAQGQIISDEQEQQDIPQLPPPSPVAPPGRVADSTVGQVGQRQTREQAAQGIAPTARIRNRISNRVQSRLRNRIDRSYDPQANAADPFAVAADRLRTTGNPRR